MANNRVQQRFDRSIREAVAETARVKAARPARARVRMVADEPAWKPRKGWGLYLNADGATVYGPLANRPKRAAPRDGVPTTCAEPTPKEPGQ